MIVWAVLYSDTGVYYEVDTMWDNEAAAQAIADDLGRDGLRTCVVEYELGS